MERESMVFYKSWLEAIKNLPREIQGEVLTAIIEYGLKGETTESLKPITKAMLALIKPQIDANNVKYTNGKKGAEYGKLGGKPQKVENPKITPKVPQSNPKQTPKEPQANPKVTPNVLCYNDNVIKKESISKDIPKKGGLSLSERIDYENLKNYFNKTFVGKLPVIMTMTDNRKKSVKARISQYGKDGIMKAFENVLESPFLLGSNDRNWQCDFDWIFKPTNFTKILEGNYNGKSVGAVSTGSYPCSETAKDKTASRGALEELADAVLEQH